MIFVFYFFAAVLTFLSWKSLRGGIYYLDFFKSELAEPESNFAPFCSIIAPCRGLDEDLETNLAALFRQNFPAFEIIFVVDDERDAAVPIIEKLVSESDSTRAEIIVAPKTRNASQKIENLREGVLHVSDESKILVFVDSDARPNADWLRNLIAPLTDEKIGCATGYRWFVQKRKGNLAAHFRAVWNASIASALGANLKGNFCWGGSTAMRRHTFERLKIREKWRGAVSDDFVITRALKEASLQIYFVPQCLTATVETCGFRQLLEFTTRQMKITRVYAPNLWLASFIGSFLFVFVFWTGVALLFVLSDWHFVLTAIFVAVNFAFGTIKARLRLSAVKLVLKEYEHQINAQFPSQLTLWTLTPVLYFYNCLCAAFSRKIIWRGIEYYLKSATETETSTTKQP